MARECLKILISLIDWDFSISWNVVPSFVHSAISDGLGCEISEAVELFLSLQCLVKHCLYEGLSDRQLIIGLFPGNVHACN